MESRHPVANDDFDVDPSSASPARSARGLPARSGSARRRDGDDVGGTLQVIEHDPEEYEEEESSDEEHAPGTKRRRGKHGKAVARRSIKISYIGDKSRRNITFNKRKTGILKKAHELSVLTGADVLLLIASRDTEQVYTFSTPNMYPLTSDPIGRQNIQNCLRFGSIHPPSNTSTSAQPPIATTSSSRPPHQQQPSSSPENMSAYAGGHPGQASVAPGGSSVPARPPLSLAMPAPGFSPQQQYQQPYSSPSPERSGGVRYGSVAPSQHAGSSGQQGLAAGQMTALAQHGSGGGMPGAPEGNSTPAWEAGHPHSAPATHQPQVQQQFPAQPGPNRTVTRSFMPSPGFGPFANYPNPAHLQHQQRHSTDDAAGAAQPPAGLPPASGLAGAAGAGTEWLASAPNSGHGRGSVSAGTAKQPGPGTGAHGAGGGPSPATRSGGTAAQSASYLASALGPHHGRRGSDVNATGQPYSESDGGAGPAYGGQISSGGSDQGLDDQQYFKQEPTEESQYGPLP